MATADPNSNAVIVTRSVGEGLDFACNLLADAMACAADNAPPTAPTLLRLLAQYVEFRYVGEEGLALEYLDMLAAEIGPTAGIRWGQFWAQMRWLSAQMHVALRTPEAG